MIDDPTHTRALPPAIPPAGEEARFPAGSVLAGRYRIVISLGGRSPSAWRRTTEGARGLPAHPAWTGAASA
jgi:hypothetical protein